MFGEKESTEHEHFGGLILGLGGGQKVVRVLVLSHLHVGKKTHKHNRQKSPGQP